MAACAAMTVEDDVTGRRTTLLDRGGKVCDAPRTISNAGRALVMAKDKAVKAARQLEVSARSRPRTRRQARPQRFAAPVGRLAYAARQERHRSIRDQHRRRRRDRLAVALADARQLHPPLRRQGHRLFRRHAHRPRLAAQSRWPLRQAEGARCAAVRPAALPVPYRPQRRASATIRDSRVRSPAANARPPTTRTTSSSTTTCRTTSTRSSSTRRWSTPAPTTPTGTTTWRRRSATSWR